MRFKNKHTRWHPIHQVGSREKSFKPNALGNMHSEKEGSSDLKETMVLLFFTLFCSGV